MVRLGAALAMLLSDIGCGGDARAPTPTPLWNVATSSVPLDAAVRFTGTQFVIENRSPDMWREVHVLVGRSDDPPAYAYRADAILGGRSLTIGALNFARPNDMRLNPFRVTPQRWMVAARLPDGRTGQAEGHLE
jgi:hypothetical protein